LSRFSGRFHMRIQLTAFGGTIGVRVRLAFLLFSYHGLT
jgi:hypothetical protein